MSVAKIIGIIALAILVVILILMYSYIRGEERK